MSKENQISYSSINDRAIKLITTSVSSRNHDNQLLLICSYPDYADIFHQSFLIGGQSKHETGIINIGPFTVKIIPTSDLKDNEWILTINPS